MSIPAALVRVRIRRIVGLSGGVLRDTTRVFAVAAIGGRVFGRSRVIPANASEHDLEREPTPWEEVVQVALREDIAISLALYDDHGRGPARLLPGARILGRLRFPYEQTSVTLGDGVRVELSVDTRFVPAAAGATVPRSSSSDASGTHVQVPSADAATVAVVEMFNIRGLYSPDRPNPARHSMARMGYRSENHQGRVFTNTALDGTYRRAVQQIELRVRIHLRRGRLPQGTLVRWRVLDVDDPVDADPRIASQWLDLLEPGDYDVDGTPYGSRGDDNLRRRGAPFWEAVAGFGLRVHSAAEATTEVVGEQSTVVMTCPGAAGDNFMVEADLVFPQPGPVSYEARTGIITMWHRVFVEQVRMRSALALPISDVAPVFAPAFIEVNFADARVIDDRVTLAADRDAYRDAVIRFIDDNFEHARQRQPGWFFLAAACQSYGARSSPIIYPRGPATLSSSGSTQYLDLPTALTAPDNASAAEVHWHDGSGPRMARFLVRSGAPHGTGTRLVLWANDFTPHFTEGDGSESHAYSRRIEVHLQGRVRGGVLTPPGYGAPTSVQAEVRGSGGATAGDSPFAHHGDRNYFAGRTVIYTHHPSFSEERDGSLRARPDAHAELVRHIAHELCHAFGMPHRCGLFDVRGRVSARSGNNACVMNYVWHPLLDASGENILQKTEGRVGAMFCGRHLVALRRVELHTNPALQQVGW